MKRTLWNLLGRMLCTRRFAALVALAICMAAPSALSQTGPFALAAKQNIDLKGNGITTDSFDSGD